VVADGEAVEALVGEVCAELARGEAQSRRPASTYRLQLAPGFRFEDAAAVVPYLHALGVTDVYLSPILEAAPGSAHGYDVVDHGRLSSELGGEAGYEALYRALTEHGMGQLVDFVPNHMGVGPYNPLWIDVLENGPSSAYATFFDIEWRPVKTELENKVLVPVLGEQYGVALERGELRLLRDGGAFLLHYCDHRFPISPRSVPQVIRHRLTLLQDELGPEHPDVWELESICTSLEKLAPRSETDPAKVTERAREKEVAKRRLAALCEKSPRIREFVDENLALFNGRPRDPRSFDLLDQLLDSQAYRLAHWRVAGEEINYRRFFDVNDLAAIRMEDPRVFDEAHRLVLRLLGEGKVTGLRIDHPDGLYDPTRYFRRLQASFLVERARAKATREGRELGAETADALLERLCQEIEAGRIPARALYVVAEKILMNGEKMPSSWAIDGTSGYEFVSASSGLFVDPANARAFDALYARFTSLRQPWREIAYERKRLIMSSTMASEMHMLAHRLDRISETNRRTRDFTLNELTLALATVVALFPVYRTYVNPRGEVDERDRQYIEATLARARRVSPLIDPSIYDFLRDVLLLRYPEGLCESERAEWREFALKLQQVTGPVTAKALEDTALYVFNRLVVLNEVGSDPRQFGTSPAEFHAMNRLRLEAWPGSLNTTSTHDTKRSEDVRARIAALSEIPGEWRGHLARFARSCRRHRSRVDGDPAPDRNDEILIYQTLVGTLPDGEVGPNAPGWDAYVQRMLAYVEKAIREAKVHTSWTRVNAEYEAAARRFVEAALASRPFLDVLSPLARRVAHAGRISSLSQVALKCAAPGVCDVYQGCELWDLSLVDPDNRRPVDFALRRRMLEAIARRLAEGRAARAALAREVSTSEGLLDGRAKLLLLREGLRLRRAEPQLFHEGGYEPLEAEGPHSAHVVAFARRLEGRVLLCVAPRLVMRLLEQGAGRVRWQGRLPLPQGFPEAYEDVVTGERHLGGALELEGVFDAFPVALLLSR
jgi:(1->4)-alpha-D-glucan 1-alpha-D-glucosylmutase